MEFQNNNKNPNDLHDYLIENNCKPVYLWHDAVYNSEGTKRKEATKVWIEIEDEKEQELIDLVNQFMAE